MRIMSLLTQLLYFYASNLNIKNKLINLDCRWDYIQDGDNILKDMDRMLAFRKGLMTWAKWVDLEVDLTKTQVFFQGISPSHYK